MKKLVILLLSFTFVIALPIKDNSLESDNNEPEDGWFVPQHDGSLKWVTEEEAQLEVRALLMSRKKKEVKVEFYLYTKDSPDTPEQIYIDDISALEKSSFNSAHETRIIIHGWLNTYESDVNTEIREALLSVAEFNVICVDWSDKADRYNYYSATTAIPKVGQKVANMIEFLRDEANMISKDLKVIGHSLGAHVAGFAGKLIQGERLETIIGLDTAFPLYKYDNCEERLCKTDAVYVESVHTNGRLLGFLKPIGQAAFYPNGGKTQPGCGIDLTGSCSHSRAFTYYAEAIRKAFIGLKCKHWKEAVQKDCPFDGAPSLAQLNNDRNKHLKKGSFYSPVNKKAPYGLGNIKETD